MYADGVRYLDKAPFLYWVTAGSYKIFGFTEFSTRLPLTLFVLVCVLAVFFLARDIGGEEAGFFAGLVWVTAVGPYIYTRFLIPDLIVALWLTVSIHLLLRTFDEERPSRALFYGLGALTALNVLTKGLIGVIFPIAILGCYLLVTGNWGHLKKLRLFSTSVVFLVIAVPWHWLATVRNPPQGEAKGFFWFYFINEQVNRYLNKRIPHDYDKVPLLIFWGLVLVFLLPWSGYLVAALRQLPVRWRDIRSAMTRE
jgi:4-amino-4-deoxy-L-arabinose transferase-like glycosyltransferase